MLRNRMHEERLAKRWSSTRFAPQIDGRGHVHEWQASADIHSKPEPTRNAHQFSNRSVEAQ